MGCKWSPIGFMFSRFLFLIICLPTRSSFSLDLEGFSFMQFRARLDSDPHGGLANWDGGVDKLCSWFGVTCVDGKMQMLNHSGCFLEGTLAPEVNPLSDLKSLLLSGNEFEDDRTIKLPRLQSPSELWDVVVFGCANRKFGLCDLRRNIMRLHKAQDLLSRIKTTSRRYVNALYFKMFHKESPSDHGQSLLANLPSNYLEESIVSRRRQLLEETSNLAAAPSPSATSPSPGITSEVFSRSSGSFPAVPSAKKRAPPLIPTPPFPSEERDDKKSRKPRDVWLYVIIGLASLIVLLIAIAFILLCRRRAVKSMGPWKTGLSGQLQKAFVTGVPKLNRSELETSCEDFSNIIEAFDGYTVYKGTLSSGVEIAVASTAVSASKQWTRAMEMAYRRKIDTLSRINHKNFVNLIGFCEEDEPFNRMMVFEYAPNGNLYEHLHVEEMEHLDWSVRVRIIMGTAYCLQYMHELNPPVAHSILCSYAIYLTDDYAAKVAEVPFNSETGLNPRKTVSGDLDQSVLPIPPEPENNVYTFGVLMLEIISGKLPYSDDVGSIEQWASKYLENGNLRDMVDPTLKSFKDEELEVICYVIRQCLRPDPRHRPTMKDVAEQLKQVINISPEQATPRLSPLWWAELEILSSEAT